MKLMHNLLGWAHFSARVLGALIMLLVAYFVAINPVTLRAGWEMWPEVVILVIAAPLSLWDLIESVGK